MKVFIKEKSLLAKLAALKMKSGKMAIVFGNTIHLHNTTAAEFLADEQWVNHELKHVEQYQQMGRAGFVFRYLVQHIKKGYYHNRFEEEARACEDQPWPGEVFFIR